MPASGRVIIIGGGVIGAACAYFLAKRGWRVTILEQGEFGRGCSHGNCGFVSPSHVLPLAGPGAVVAALKSMLRPNSPFTIRPRLDWSLWSWLWRFARRCNARDMLPAGHAIQALLNSSRTLYQQIIESEQMACEWETRGCLFVFQTKPAMEHHAETERLLHDEFGLNPTRYDGEGLVALEPALRPGLAGGWHHTTDAHLRPDRLMAEWKRVLPAKGVTIREKCGITGFTCDGATALAVRTAEGEFAADAFVVAAGAWTPLFNRELGCAIPIQPGKGYSITMPRPKRCPRIPVLFEEHRVGVTPMQSGYRLGSTMEFAGYDATLNRKRLAILREGARHYLHEPECEPVLEEWFGWRPMTPDSVPIIDRSPRLANVWIAAGHNMLGLSMAPATGQLVAELVSGEKPHVEPGPYCLSRFR